MSDPRNVAHDKKVKQEKEHEKPEVDAEEKSASAEPVAATTAEPSDAAVDHEKSVTVLSKLKEMEFHSRANIETLAGLTLTIEDELKQKEFSDPIGALYSAQDQFHTKITEMIESYGAHVDGMKPSA